MYFCIKKNKEAIMEYIVKRIEHKKDMDDFFAIPSFVYCNFKHYIPESRNTIESLLDTNKNPYFMKAEQALFVCYKSGSPVARCFVSINNNVDDFGGVKTAYFGFFECINDFKAAECLFLEAEKYCRNKKALKIEGPFSPNHYTIYGLQLDNFNTPYKFTDPFNPKYYEEFLIKLGFSIQKRGFIWKNDNLQKTITEKFGGMSFPQQLRAYSIRKANIRTLRSDMEKITEFFEDTFSQNWHSTAINQHEYAYLVRFFSYCLQSKLICFIEKDGETVGTLICMNDINPYLRTFKYKWLVALLIKAGIIKPKNLIVYAIGITSSHRNSYAVYLLLSAFCFIGKHYQSAESSWISEGNIASERIAQKLEMLPYKTYAVYEKYLSPLPPL